ncbi:hypothetical protein D3C78_1705280 [compost metagenome]
MLNLSGIAQRQFVFDIVEEHIHTQGFGKNTELRTDVAVTNDPELFATRFIRA